MSTPDAPSLHAGAVVTRRNDLLVLRRELHPAEGCWSIPTAPVQLGETLVEAATRSVRECTGLSGLSGPFLGWYESMSNGPQPDAQHQVVMCFEVVVFDGADPVPGPGVADAVWMPVWEVSELPLVDGLATLLAEHGVIDTLT